MKNPEILVTICARGGSKGLQNKNTLHLLGKPLISYTINQAIEWGRAKHVVVSTDSESIADIAKQYGAEVPFIRPENLARDDSPKLPVLKHVVNYYIENKNFTPDLIVDLDPTSPLRSEEDIEKCVNTIIKDSECESVITGFKANKNPYFNMVESDSNGYVRLSKPTAGSIARRQDAPIVYAMNASIYVWRTSSLLEQTSVISEKAKLIEMPEERSVDIDSLMDFKLVEVLLRERESDDFS